MAASRDAGDHAQAEVKTRLFDAAAELLHEAGPSKLSLREVARRAGVSHAAPYNHFENKEALLAALALEGWRALDASMADAQQMADAAPYEQLVATGLGYLRYALQHPAAYQLMHQQEFHSQAHQDELQDCASGPYRRLLAAVTSLRQAREMSLDDNALQGDCLILWGLVHGLASLSIDTGVEALPSDNIGSSC